MHHSRLNLAVKVFFLLAFYLLFSIHLYCQSQLPTCNNSTFFLHIPVTGGGKIELSRLQTFPDGNYLATGSITSKEGLKQGLLILLSNQGVILKQKNISISNNPTLIIGTKISSNGDAFIAGYFNDNSKSAFIARITEDFNVSWCKIISQDETPIKVTLDIYDQSSIAFATQLSNSINYYSFDLQGNIQWNKSLSTPGLSELIAFTGPEKLFGALSISINCNINGKQMIQVVNVYQTDGNILSTNIEGNGIEENKGLGVSAFNNRVNLIGVTKNLLNRYQPFRSNVQRSDFTETYHQYNQPVALDFSVTGAIDNSGDALGFFIPSSRRLLFIKHFSMFETSVQFCREYQVPNASAIVALARSYDGGFLFGLNSSNSNEIIIIKTDSIGTLPGCGYESIQISSTEKRNESNIRGSSVMNSNLYSDISVSVQTNDDSLITDFSCNQNYCPTVPAKDTCLNSFFKTLRPSTSFTNFTNNYFLMRNNHHILYSYKNDRITGGFAKINHSLELLDESGQLLKSVKIISDSTTPLFDIYQMDDHQLMLVFNASVTEQAYNFTLLNDNLEKIWSKTVKTQGDFNSQGLGASDVHKDAEGNFYVISTQLGFTDKPKIFIYKMDSLGNELWTKAYETSTGSFYQANITSTSSSIIIVITGSNIFSMELDKSSGNLKGTYAYASNWDASTNTRFMKYSNGTIFFAGSDKNNNMLLATFDSTGKPIKEKHLNLPLTSIAWATIKNGYLYGQFYIGNDFKYGLFKVDNELNFQFIEEYQTPEIIQIRGLGVTDAGFIYSAGNFGYQGANGGDPIPYILKFGPNGEMGNCPVNQITTNLVNATPGVFSFEMQPLARKYNSGNYSVNLIPDNLELNYNKLICSSIEFCNTFKLLQLDPVCFSSSDIFIHFKKSINCTLIPTFIFDTSFALIKIISDSTVTLNFKKPGNIYLKGILKAACKEYIDSIIIHVQPEPSALTLGADSSVCKGDEIILHAGPGFDQYNWQDGSNDSVFHVSHSGKYYVTVSNSCGQPFSDSINIIELPKPGNFLNATDSICNYSVFQINVSGKFEKYLWSTGSTASSIVVSKAGLYTLQVTNKEGCSAKGSIRVIEKGCVMGLYVPNAFTPNGDNLNDIFKAEVREPLINFYFQVFNRLGETIFSSTDSNKGWDGTYKGIKCEAGNYVWQCSYQIQGANKIVRKGSVILIR